MHEIHHFPTVRLKGSFHLLIFSAICYHNMLHLSLQYFPSHYMINLYFAMMQSPSIKGNEREARHISDYFLVRTGYLKDTEVAVESFVHFTENTIYAQ